MATGTVTLEKAYFETLLRRAQCHTSGVDFTTPVDLPTVTIPKSDHDSLLTSARHYANLRRNLYRGGIAEETLTVLIKDDASASENDATDTHSTAYDTSDGGAFLREQSVSSSHCVSVQDYTFGRNANYTPRNSGLQQRDNRFQIQSNVNDDFAFMPEELSNSSCDGGNGYHDPHVKVPRHKYEKFAMRTVQLSNLADNVTHADIVDVVRGGMLLDIYLRTQDRTASVSFLDETHAQDFFRHVKQHDLYIRDKRAEIRWNDRQFILTGYVSNKIAIGATRNLIIHNCSPRHTEKAIRDDLEHIHNLVIIKIKFSGQAARLSTNSVHHAMFARTCMMSRSTYKTTKIEWDDDECAATIDKPKQLRQVNVPLKKEKDAPLMNRFQVLHIDGMDDGSLEGDNLEADEETFKAAIPTNFGIPA